jgi:hypothetical protein
MLDAGLMKDLNRTFRDPYRFTALLHRLSDRSFSKSVTIRTGQFGDIGVPLDDAPMDFSAWFEAYLGGRWYTFYARHNKPRIGRILMARGRDATDVAIVTSFGPGKLAGFN